MAGLDVSMSLFDFLAVVDLPRVHPHEVLQEVEKFLKANGIMEFWHMEGITMNAFKRDSFKDAFMIGHLPCLLSGLACVLDCICCQALSRERSGRPMQIRQKRRPWLARMRRWKMPGHSPN